jgi:hypothetical protein
MFVQNLMHFAKALYFLFLAGARRRTRTVIGTIRFVLHFIREALVALGAWIILGDRGLITILLFTWFRQVDDVLDGDATPPFGETLNIYGIRNETVVRQMSAGIVQFYCMHPEDVLLKWAVTLATHHELAIGQLTLRGWECVIFDAERRRRKQEVQRQALDRQAMTQDEIFLELFIVVLGGSMATWANVKGSVKGVFTRSDWLLDLHADMRRGLVNVPATELGGARSLLNWQKQEHARIVTDFTSLKENLGGTFGSLFPTGKMCGRLGSYILSKAFDRKLLKGQKERLEQFEQKLNKLEQEEATLHRDQKIPT